ncbi:hypothetical protein F0562_008566 [Nyssa sinensis]|uniref:X8 domain-containing protein n=1 Tax=Nyssa sinensis TaxID=561372 RepID=A0A5J5A7Z0_9ASTE|nr:hypothetical protein F0562_008566 [Nyssa sinensis]
MGLTSRVPITNLCILGLCLCFAAVSFTHCNARRPMQVLEGPTKPRSSTITSTKKIMDSSNSQPYAVSSPFTLPPYDSLAPIPLPENTPPFCLYPPFTPQPAIGGGGAPPPPSFPIQCPPPSPVGTVPPNPPTTISSPPENVPNPPIYFPSPTAPPYNYEPTPPSYAPNPPFNVPNPRSSSSPPIFEPPVVYPPPRGHPPPHTGAGPSVALWCVAKPSVPEPIIEEAMNYACGSGADCDSIQPNGSCFEPNTVMAHASYAFNSYWQRTRVAGGTCEFGGAAMLVSVDPSNDGCHFIYY